MSTALAMAWGGARGETAEEMQRVLRLPGPAGEKMRECGRLLAELQNGERGVTFRIANRLFGERGYCFEPSYLEAARAAHGAPLEALDFKRGFEVARVYIKRVEAEAFGGRMVNLAAHGGTLIMPRRLRALPNLKPELRPSGRRPVEIYGKVVHVSADGSVGVRFTSLPS